MSIKKSQSQLLFETMFTGANGKPFDQISKGQIIQTQLTNEQAEILKNFLLDEMPSYYYKSLLSYMESIVAIKDKLFSWATVRLYYSVFYSIKAYLASQEVAILREKRRLYYVKAKENEFIKKCDDTTDHKATINTLKKLYNNIDWLLSNNIEEIDAYHWMMKKREEVNYRDLDFHDPNAPEFWSTINREIENNDIKAVIDNLVKDEGLLCFQDEYAILGIPTKRIILTVDEIKKQGKYLDIPDEKKELIDSMSNILSDDSIAALEIWKRI